MNDLNQLAELSPISDAEASSSCLTVRTPT